MSFRQELLWSLTLLLTAISITEISTVPVFAETFGRTSAIGNWTDENWVDSAGQMGPVQSDDWSSTNVTIGRAGFPYSSALGSASVNLSQDFPLMIDVLQVGGDLGDRGILNVQSNGHLQSFHALVGVNGGEGIVNVAEGGIFEAHFSLEIGANGSFNSYGEVDAVATSDVVNRGTITIDGGQFRTWKIYQPGGSLFLNGGLLDAGAYVIDHGELHLVAGTLRSYGPIFGLQLKDSHIIRTDDVIIEGTILLDNTDLELREQDQIGHAELRNGATLSLGGDTFFSELRVHESALVLGNHVITVSPHSIFEFKKGSMIDRGGPSGGIISGFTSIEGAEFTYDGADELSSYLDIIGGAKFTVNKQLNLTTGPNAYLSVVGRDTSFTANAPVSAQSLNCWDHATTKLFGPVTAQHLSASEHADLYIHNTANVEFLGVGRDAYVQIAQDSRRTDGVTVGQAIYVGSPNSPLVLVFDDYVVPGELDWALRWKGDNRDMLIDMMASAIHVESAPRPVEVIYDPEKFGDFTYIGYFAEVPEPSAWLLVSICAFSLTAHRRIQ